VTEEHSFVPDWYRSKFEDLFNYNYCATCRYTGCITFLEAKHTLEKKLVLEQQAHEAEQARIAQLREDFGWSGADLILSLEKARRENQNIRRMCRDFTNLVMR
jgi:hypothetical protein